MKPHRMAALMVLLLALLAGCGSDEASKSSTTTAEITTTAEPGVTTSSSTQDTSTTSTTVAPETTTTLAVTLEQLAIWPAADVVFSNPTDAAADFVAKVLNVSPELGEFKQGDSRSGEIDVLSLGEGSGPALVRSTLILRQLGPDDGWFVLAAVNENITIDSPEAMAMVAFGPTEVLGKGRGFEGTLVVEAFLAGDASSPLSGNIVQGGSGADPEPYSAIVVLQGPESEGLLKSGDVVLLLVRGGVGLETDPGEFTAIGVTIA